MSARTALISGANRGIGLAIAQRLAADGWNLSLGVRRPEAVAPALAQHHVVPYDASKPGSEKAWVEEALRRYGRIDAIVNNAGILVTGSVIEASEAGMQSLLEINVMAPLRLVRAAWEPLAACGRGRVVTVVSLSGKRVKSARSGAYSVSKFAALALAHAIRHAGWDKGIRSTAICPGFVATDMAFAVSSMKPEDMTPPTELARIVSLVLDLPNTASIAEIPINCNLEESF